MTVVRTRADLTKHDGSRRTVVLAAADDHDLIERAISVLGFDDKAGRVIRAELSVRPSVEFIDTSSKQDTRQDVLSAVLVGDEVTLIPLMVATGSSGVLVIAQHPDSVSGVADVVDRSAGEPIAAALTDIARRSEDSLEATSTRLHDSDDAVSAHLAGLTRKEVLMMRQRLNTIVDVFEAQRQLTSRDGDVAHLPGVDPAVLRKASSHFSFCGDFAGRLYDLVGDALSQRSSIISERLTVVNTIFLPLTLAASFFGMNFNWLTSHIESGTSFVVLAFVAPAVVAAFTYVALRRFVR